MKGIKECFNWLVDNEGRKLTNSYSIVWFDGNRLYIESRIGAEHCIFTNLNWFNEHEWKPVKEPIDVKEAMCALNDFKVVECVFGSKKYALTNHYGTILCSRNNDEFGVKPLMIAEGVFYLRED